MSVGSISVQVYLLTPQKVYQEMYSGINWNGESTGNWIVDNYLINTQPEGVWNGDKNGFSSYIIGAFLAPATTSIEFNFECDDGWIIDINCRIIILNFFN